jgi:amino acid adenylation domain-containing protein
VPVDPRYSREWLKFILDDTGAALLLTERRWTAGLPESAAAVLCLEECESAAESSFGESRAAVSGSDLAYIIYTSGSTGAPKGVEVTHGALANFAAEAAASFELGPADRVLQFASISFDTSAEEIFPCLIAGAQLALRPDPLPSSAANLLEHCRAREITVLDLPTAYWHELVIELVAERRTIPEPIRLMIIGGEKARPERRALWQAFVAGSVRLLNTYGPTEATVAATIADLTEEPAECGVPGEASIGRPFGNVQVLILDHDLNPVPTGVPGELYIGGVGLARGYLNGPELTAERFIPHPFDERGGSRLYRSGDVGRCREDGQIEFLGRADDQIKIRGFRVEPQGVAALLRQHALIRDAAVLNEKASGSERLVAYVVPEGGGMLNLREVQSFLRGRLPEYMIPAAIVTLEALPLTARGKLDREALRRARSRQGEAAENLTPPRTPMEERIAEIWRELLSREGIGREQHFFEIGGHSLLAAQAISRLRRDFGVEIPLRAIFEAPTIASLAERVERCLREHRSAQETAPVPLGAYRGEAPVSDSQSRIWFMDRLAPEASAYNITAAIRFAGEMDRPALRRSLDRLVERHEALRTTIEDRDGEPVQVIAPALQLELPEINLRATPAELRLDKARQMLRDEGRRPFDLSRGPLVRVLLLELDDRDHILLLSMHHLISDQWSLAVIAREIGASYNACRNGSAPAQEPLPAQYGDFAVWQSRQLAEGGLAEDFAYWKRQLAGMQPATVAPDRPRPAVQSFSGAHRSLPLSGGLLAGLRKLALEENATLYMVFLAAFKIVLSRYSGREDIGLGSPVAKRTRAEWDGVIGTFINVLVLRTDLAGNPSLREVVRRVREVALDAFTHQEAPFHKLVEELAPGRDASRSPLVQILFNFQSAPVGQLDFEGLSWAPLEIDQWASQFDLGVTVDPEITRKIFLTYNTDLYDGATIERLLGHYEEALEGLAANPEQSLAALATASAAADGAAESNRLPYPEACFHEVFEAQAARTPDAIALVYERRHLSYRELNEHANRVARRLRAVGVGAESLVGICAERSIELVVGLLAVAKAGGAYVPIDPAYPSERVDFILKDSGMAALLTQKALAEELPARAPAGMPTGRPPVLYLDESTEPEPDAAANLKPLAGPDQLAYVIYTSGSTGRPKGVQITHRALVSFLYSMKERPGIGPADALLSVTTVSFDIAVLELFLPLITGARVVVADRPTAADGRALAAELAACGATMMQATPATWRMMIEAGWQGAADFKAICGGENLPLSLARELSARSASLWNLYGPTETTVWSAIWEVEPGCDRIVIGGPIHNTRIHILDDKLCPVPIGVAGEICIAGEGLARGYLQRPELTAERFISNPFGAPSSRLYRTGDRGRYLADGSIEFIGRSDNQIKLRGFRIELGEIEAALAAHEDVKQAVAAVQGEGLDKRLIAYIVPCEGRTVAEPDISSFARGKLPGYMVPSLFVPLENLPLTPNGKVDRQALPHPEHAAASGESNDAPADRLEFELAHLWRKCLGARRIGLHDNFFDLGADSLRAAALVAQIEKRFGIAVRLVDFLTAPTVSAVASLLRHNGCSARWSSLFPIRASGSRAPFFWVHGDGSNFLLPAYLADRPLYGFLHQECDGRPPRAAGVEEIAARYLEELLSVQPEGPYFLGGYSFGGLVAFEMAQQLRERGQGVALLVMLEATTPGAGAPAAAKPPAKEAGARSRLKRHLAGLGPLSAAQLPAYAAAAVVTWAQRVSGFARLKRTVQRAVSRYCVRRGRPPPPWTWRAYLLDMYAGAAKHYQTEIYPGHVWFVKGANTRHDHLAVWGPLVGGPMAVFETAGNHAALIQQPQLGIWAAELNDRLNHAEEEIRGANDPR